VTSRWVGVSRVDASTAEETTDRVAVELPLEVRLHGEPFSVIMRTPGADRELAAGFLYSEGLLRASEDLARIDTVSDHVIDVWLRGEPASRVVSFLDQRRQVATNSSCGMCGRRSLETLDIDEPPLDAGWSVSREVIVSLPGRLRAVQATFDDTGGLHAAALFDASGSIDVSAEDVGRHNAVDKLCGRMLLVNRLPLADRLLFVSGRTSFEIVQKAFCAGAPIVAAVSAPSSLAIDVAVRAGITLIGFVRGERFNVYCHAHRVTPA
jgi:FdhD protein